MSNITTIGLSLAEHVFQIFGLNKARKIIFNRQVKRNKLILSLVAHPHALIAMEACGSAHYWTRQLMKARLKVKLIPAQHVKAFTYGSKK